MEKRTGFRLECGGWQQVSINSRAQGTVQAKENAAHLKIPQVGVQSSREEVRCSFVERCYRDQISKASLRCKLSSFVTL
jgi:hypothetical protein